MINLENQDNRLICCASDLVNRARGCSTHHTFADALALVDRHIDTVPDLAQHAGGIFGQIFKLWTRAEMRASRQATEHAQCALNDAYHLLDILTKGRTADIEGNYICPSYEGATPVGRRWGRIIFTCQSCGCASPAVEMCESENGVEPVTYLSRSNVASEELTAAVFEHKAFDLPTGWTGVWPDENHRLIVCPRCRSGIYSDASTSLD